MSATSVYVPYKGSKREIKLVSNQKFIKCVLVKTGCELFARQKALKDLTVFETVLYRYLLDRGYYEYWALSKENVLSESPLTEYGYHTAVEGLIKKGYLVKADYINTGISTVTSNAYYFYEDPTNEAQKHKKAETPKSNKTTAVITTPAIGRNRVVALDKTEVF